MRSATARRAAPQALRGPESARRGQPTEASSPAFCAAGAGDETGLRAAAAALAEGSRTDRERGAVLAAGARPRSSAGRCSTAYIGAFLTDEGETRQMPDHQGRGPRRRPAMPWPCCRAEAERILRFWRDATGGSAGRGERALIAARRRVAGRL